MHSEHSNIVEQIEVVETHARKSQRSLDTFQHLTHVSRYALRDRILSAKMVGCAGRLRKRVATSAAVCREKGVNIYVCSFLSTRESAGDAPESSVMRIHMTQCYRTPPFSRQFSPHYMPFCKSFLWLFPSYRRSCRFIAHFSWTE